MVITIINKGTFGVLVLIKNNLPIKIGQTIYIQVGKTYIKAEVSKTENKEKEGSQIKKFEKKESNEELKNESNNDSEITTEKSQSEINTRDINI